MQKKEEIHAVIPSKGSAHNNKKDISLYRVLQYRKQAFCFLLSKPHAGNQNFEKMDETFPLL